MGNNIPSTSTPTPKRFTRVRTDEGSSFHNRLKIWLDDLQHGGSDKLYVAPSQACLIDMVCDEGFHLGGGFTVQIVDAVFNKPWKKFTNVSQFVFVCNNTGDYFRVSYIHTPNHVCGDDSSSWELTNPMVIRKLKLQVKPPNHLTCVGEEGRYRHRHSW